MVNPASIVFLALFALTVLLVYLSIRRNWLTLTISTVIGAAATSLFFVLFSLAQGNVLTHALLVGPLLGLLFTGLTAAAAAYFKANSRLSASAPEQRSGEH